MPAQDPPEGYSTPDLPDEAGYSVPDLSGDAAAAVNLASSQSGNSVSSTGGGRFAMKPMGAEFQQGEKNSSAATVTIGGEAVEVHEKDWLRQQTDAKRASEGKSAATDEMWKANVATTQYMNESQAAAHQVGFEAGTDATGAANAKLTGDSVEQGKKHIFVMDGEGGVYAKGARAAVTQQDDSGRGVHVHHSSFLAGEDVAGAGELQVGQDGFLKGVTDRSGHYKPGEEQTTQTLAELENKGVNLDNVKFTLDRGTEKVGGMAKEYQQGGEQTFKARHTMADELKERGASVREALDRDADRRATRVNKLEGYLDEVKAGGLDYQDVKEAAEAHAGKDATALEKKLGGGLKDQLDQQKEDLAEKKTVRESLGKDLGQPPPKASHSVRVK
ncbi:MAG TPA: hypothetical protein VD994_01190 [Prosthecobacter sp.]|nr:hypothetical protein [Prosthecobacter sp.]